MEVKDILSDILRRWVLPYAKAWAAVATFWVFGVLASFNIQVPQEVQTQVISAVTTFVVWLVPNIPYAKR